MEIKAEKLTQLLIELRAGEGYRPFAKRIGLSHGSIQSWEKGRYFPDRDSLKKLAEIKGWTIDELMAYLQGGELPAHPEISMPQLLEIIGRLSASQALEVGQKALTRAREDSLDTSERGARIAFSRGADSMNFSQLLQQFLAATPPDVVDDLLTERDLQKSRLAELVAGAYPSDLDVRKVGAIMRQADFKDSHGKHYTIERLEAIRAGSTITNGANR